MQIKVTGAQGALEQLDLLTQKLKEANDLIQSLASQEVKVQLNEQQNDIIDVLQEGELLTASYRLGE